MGDRVSKMKKKNVTKVYDIKEKLGSGSFAIVWRGVHKKTGAEVAIKIIKKSKLSKEELVTINDEVEILQSIEHDNIVRLIEIFDSGKKLCMILELLTGGELFDRIVSKGSFNEAEASKVIQQIVRALQYMHLHNVVHRDLKPENLIYSSNDDDALIKITDFGLAKHTMGSELMHTPCGTPGYVAPEILKGEAYGPEVDLWSVGVILYILLCGFPPFYDETAKGLYEQIKRGAYDFPSPYWDQITDSAKDLVERLLTVDPQDRITAEELLAHPWIAGDVASTKDLGEQFSRQLKAFNARRKLRKAITMVLAINKLARHVGLFELDDDEEKTDEEEEKEE